jgi:ribosomal protein L7/L12
MSNKIDKIVEELKSITLLEASELISKILCLKKFRISFIN